MPIYMDRHNVSETVTAEYVAHLHQEDLKIQHRFGCRGLTYWFDDNRKTAFCLIEAPDADAIEKMHNTAHGQVPHRIIEVNANIVESFLGRIEDPQKAQNTELNIINDPAFRTIMVAEINSLPFQGKAPGQLKTSLHKFNNAILKTLNEYEGNRVKHTENYFLVSFKSVSNAVRAALAIRALFSSFKKEAKEHEFLFKISLNAGAPVTEKQLIFEDTIKLAQRMCTAVKGEIVVSSEVKDLYNSENQHPLQEKKEVVVISQTDEEFLSRLMDYIELNWADPNAQVENFCKFLGYSKSRLYRRIMELAEKSLNTFIKDYRLGEALKLLNKSKGNISEIAFETGFSSPSYFSKCFQKKFGLHPSAYLNNTG